MFWKIASRIAVGLMAIFAGLTVGGAITNDQGYLNAMVTIGLIAMIIAGVVLFGYGLNVLASRLNHLPEKLSRRLVGLWALIWIMAGVIGRIELDNPVPAKVSFWAGSLMAISVPILWALKTPQPVPSSKS